MCTKDSIYHIVNNTLRGNYTFLLSLLKNQIYFYSKRDLDCLQTAADLIITPTAV